MIRFHVLVLSVLPLILNILVTPVIVYARTGRLIPIMVSHWLSDVVGFSTMYFINIG